MFTIENFLLKNVPFINFCYLCQKNKPLKKKKKIFQVEGVFKSKIVYLYNKHVIYYMKLVIFLLFQIIIIFQ